MITAQGLGYTFLANDLASGPINKLNANVKRLASTSEAAQISYNRNMALIKQGAKELMVGGAVWLGINSLTKSYGQFEIKLASAGAIMGATTSEMRMLERAAIDAGIATQFSPTEAVAGLEALGAAGMTAADAVKTLNPTLDLAAASLGQLGVGEAAQNVVGVLNAFGDTADYARKRVDQLVKITQMSNFQARDFSIAISQAAAQAAAADQTFESMTATLGMLRNTNLDASSAATAYREATRRLAGDQQALKQMRKLGIDSLEKETGKIKDLGAIMAEVIPAVETLNSQERNLALKRMFGVRGMKTYNAFQASYNKLLKEGKVATGDYAGAHRILVEGLENSQGTAAKTRDQLLKTAEGQRILLKGSVDTFKVVAGKALVPAILPALKSMTDALNHIIRIIDKIPKSITSFVASFAGAGATLLAFSGAIKIVAGARGLMALSKATDTTADGVAGMSARFKQTNAELAKMPLRQQATSMQGLRASTRGFGQALGASLPIIGFAAAGLMALHSMQKAREEKEKNRVKEIKNEQQRLRDEYVRTAHTVENIGRAAAAAGEKLLKLARRKDLIETQKRISEAMAKAQSAQMQLNKNLSIEQMQSLTKKEKKEMTARNLKLIQERDAARKIVEQYKYIELQIKARMSERSGSWRRSEESRRIVVAANQVKIKNMMEKESALEKKLARAKEYGQKERTKDLARELSLIRRRRESLTRSTAAIAGFNIGARGAGGMRGAERAIGRYAQPALQQITGFGDPTKATGLPQITLDYLARGVLSMSQVQGKISPSQFAAVQRYIQQTDTATGGIYREARARADADAAAAPIPGEGRRYAGEGAGASGGDISKALEWAGLREERMGLREIIAQGLREGMRDAAVTVKIDGESIPTKKANTNARSARGQASQPSE